QEVRDQVVAVPGGLECERFADRHEAVDTSGAGELRELAELGGPETKMRHGLVLGCSDLREVGQPIEAHVREEASPTDLLPPGLSVGNADCQELVLSQVRADLGLACEIEDVVQAMDRTRGRAPVAAARDLPGEHRVEAVERRIDLRAGADPEDEMR